MRTALLNIYDSLVIYFTSADWQRAVLFLKIISLIISGLLLMIIIYLIIQLRKNIKKSLEMMAESVSVPELPKKALVKQWESVLEKLEGEDENSYKMAIVEADKILDDILKRIGYAGEDIGERLKQVTSVQIANIDEIWQAHKVRNQIVHNPTFQLKRSEAKRAVEIYERALRDLGAV